MSKLKNRLDKLEGKGSSMKGLADRLEVARKQSHAGYVPTPQSEDVLNSIIATSKSNLAVRIARGQLRVMGLLS
jgi:hypothetical protein